MPVFTTFRTLCPFPVATYGEMIFMSISQVVCWTGSTKTTHLLPVKASVWARFGTACEVSKSPSSPKSSYPTPSRVTSCLLYTPSDTWEAYNQSSFASRPKPSVSPRSGKATPLHFLTPGTTRVNHFLYVGSRSDNRNLTFYHSHLILRESAVEQHLMPAFCTAR